MIFKKLYERTRFLALEVAHFSRLGKIASQRSFINRERKKLVLKLGEKVLELVEQKQLKAPELERLAKQINKMDDLLSQWDYHRGHGEKKPGKSLKDLD